VLQKSFVFLVAVIELSKWKRKVKIVFVRRSGTSFQNVAPEPTLARRMPTTLLARVVIGDALSGSRLEDVVHPQDHLRGLGSRHQDLWSIWRNQFRPIFMYG
jgi:hypothetical protein